MQHFHLFRHRSAFRQLWLARTVSFFGDTVAATALVLFVYQISNAGTAIGLVLLAQALPRLFGPFAGSLADRVDQRRLMIGCDIGQALLFALIALLMPPFPLLLVLIFLASTLATIFTPAGRSALPTLVDQGDLPAANALLSFGLNASLALGPAIGGVLVTSAGVRGVLLLDAFTFMLSAAFLQQLPALPPPPVHEEPRTTLLASTQAGIMYLAQHATARAIMIGLVLVVAFAALDNVALVVLAQETLGARATGYGALASAYGIGMVLGPLVLLRWSQRVNPAYLLLVSIFLLAGGTLVTGLAPTLAVALIAQTVGGIGNGLENIANDTLIQRTVPRAMLGRIFGIVYSGAFLASSLAYAVGGPLIDRTSPRMVFFIAGTGVLAALVVVWIMLPKDAAFYTVSP